MTQKTTLYLTGLHCVSCAVNIDLELEDLKGIKKISTNYARSVSEIEFHPEEIKLEKIIETIGKLGYEAKI